MADMFGALGSLASAGASLIGSKMSADATNKAARMNAIAAARENELTRSYNQEQLQKQWDREDILRSREEALQREFASSGIQWRAADARAAGLHPLAAMGAQTSSYSSSVGNSSYTPGVSSGAQPFAGASMGSGVSAMGQDISRAINATRTEEERVDAHTKSMQDLQLKNMALQNQVLASQIVKNTAVGPPMPSQRGNMIPGQGNTPSRLKGDDPDIKNKPHENVVRDPENPATEPGDVSDIGYSRTGRGTYMPVPSKDVKERIEDNMLQETLHLIRNNVLPMLQENLKPPNFVELKSKHHKWFYHPVSGYKQFNTKKDGLRSYFPKTPWDSNW